jgi:ADP-glucose pyrophosphorylase
LSSDHVTFAGSFSRLLDIPISNAIHSHMERILLLTQFNSVSLHRHISQTYRFDPFSKGFVQVVAAQQTPYSERWFQGTADAVRQGMPWIAGLKGDLVLVLSGDHMYRMDYREMLREHLDSAADMTIGVLPCSEEEIGKFGAMRSLGTGGISERSARFMRATWIWFALIPRFASTTRARLGDSGRRGRNRPQRGNRGQHGDLMRQSEHFHPDRNSERRSSSA